MPDTTYPLGHARYTNYDPEQVNTAEDAADLFEWLGEVNRERENAEIAQAYEDCATLLRREVVDA